MDTVEHRFDSIEKQIEAAKLFALISNQINEAVHSALLALDDTSTKERLAFAGIEQDAAELDSYRDGLADVQKAMALLNAAQNRFEVMSAQIGHSGKIDTDWTWLYAKHDIAGNNLRLETCYLGDKDFNAPNPLLLVVPERPESAEMREAISGVFKAHGFKLDSSHGQEWPEDDDVYGYWLSVDRGHDTIASMDKAFRGLGFDHVEWTGDDAHLLEAEIKEAQHNWRSGLTRFPPTSRL
ncbi:hypothetical protein [Rhizobium ruizarguesonis]|uniref:hypothetical protein n=1 Tax=Rhizobium ruizarguesonis TaxID=2081791 RepID=UPI001030C037|nr:hypothetical protein [Rhizobium ruizarguesonis]TBE08843.1 hypothetical protein ELH12_23705 [Rhizobium ruizarguesonis]